MNEYSYYQRNITLHYLQRTGNILQVFFNTLSFKNNTQAHQKKFWFPFLNIFSACTMLDAFKYHKTIYETLIIN